MNSQATKEPHSKKKVIDQREVTDKIDFTDFVVEQVLNKLGTPDKLDHVTAINLWDNRWRVNVWCTHMVQADVTLVESLEIKHSYFIYVSGDGEITKASPIIEKEY